MAMLAAAWSYPGVPYPTETTTELESLGWVAWPYDPCTIVAPDLPSPWITDTAGFYYIDSVSGTNTGRTYGNPTAARKTIPSSPDTSAVIQINGNYTKAASTITLTGTASSPCFLIPTSGGATLKEKLTVGSSSSYYIVDGIDGDWEAASSNGKLNFRGSYGCVRGGVFNGTQLDHGIGSVNINGDHLMLYNSTVFDAGFLATQTDQDTHGTKVSPGSTNIHIINDTYHHNSGNGVQAGDFNTTQVERLWIAGCIAYTNRQAGFWTKQCLDAILSRNESRKPAQTVNNIGGQYMSDYIWHLFNTCFGGSSGIGLEGRSGGSSSSSRYAIIGNLIYDQTGSVPNTNDGNSAAGIKDRGMFDAVITDNTIIDCNNIFGSAKNTPHDLHGNIFGTPKAANGRSLYLPGASSNASDTSNYNVFETTEKISFHTNTKRNLADHQSAESEDGNSSSSSDLKFVNAAVRDYHLDTGSPARNASIEHGIYAEFEARYGLNIRVDIEGTLRPTSGPWDAGCYQDNEMSDDLQVSWTAVTLDIGGQPANVLGYKIWDMANSLIPVQVADVAGTSHTLVDFVPDPNNPPPISVSAYNAQGDGARSATVQANPPDPSVPEQVGGVTAVVVPL